MDVCDNAGDTLALSADRRTVFCEGIERSRPEASREGWWRRICATGRVRPVAALFLFLAPPSHYQARTQSLRAK